MSTTRKHAPAVAARPATTTPKYVVVGHDVLTVAEAKVREDQAEARRMVDLTDVAAWTPPTSAGPVGPVVPDAVPAVAATPAVRRKAMTGAELRADRVARGVCTACG